MTENERLLLEIDRDIALCQKELVSINNIVHMHKKTLLSLYDSKIKVYGEMLKERDNNA